ncbi:ABC transporter ATP-binding protein [Streptococcus porcinus]|uniref:ABC transporter ATP-binding protein n=1 Tax=Streptococcus porcinus TaxID=1340 RepID=UPI000B8B579F|nr:ABC transporter ATP-binding protein [Streptococcus porcinus]VTT43190.1 ABC transporter ATP-binding protein [Streptococcus porcinus]
MTNAIQFKNFSFKYDAQSLPTLSNLNLTIEKGQKVLIIGPSGSGKSTIGNCLNGIIPNHFKGEHSGSLLINDKEAFDLSIYEKSKLVSTVLQDPDGQFIGLSVAEDIAFALENDCVPQSEMNNHINYWSKILDISDHLAKRPQDLSGGQKQRVSLAGVLVDESPILLFDEPLANLDPRSGLDTIDLIDRIHKSTQATTIIIEHRLEDVLYRHVDKIILINDGIILFDGTSNQLLASNILEQNGIREPLYLTCLRDLGFDIRTLGQLDQLDNLNLPPVTTLTSPKREEAHIPKEPLLSLQNVTFSYDKDHPILDNVNLNLNRGERVAIVGQNGSGKSTLAKIMCQFLEGNFTMTYGGKDISRDSIKERADRIGYVLQNPNQMISKSAIFDEVAEGLRLRGFTEEEITHKVNETLKTCGLYPYRNWPISALSFGQKKRVTIASILVLGAEIIILDEPTAGQDKKNYTEIMNFLNQLHQNGHTIVMITHDMQLMMEYADRAIVLSHGRIIADDKPENILSDEDILNKAYLKKTSLFHLAEKTACNPIDMTRYYIAKERGRHASEIDRLP